MRFKDMVAAGIGKNRPARPAKPYQDETVRIGDKVHCTWDKHKPVVGTVIGISPKRGNCWVIEVQNSNKHGQHWATFEVFNMVYCKKVRAKQLSKVARSVKPQAKPIYGLSEGDDFA